MHESLNNIDKHELDKFARLSEDWWDPNGPLKTLHIINPLRLSYIDNAVSLNQKKVLDIGCGGGLLTEAMESKGAYVTGLDANESAITVARKHANLSHKKIDYVAYSAEQYALDNKKIFDVITCMELLEHVPDPASIFSACADLLKPGGDIIVATLNRNVRSYMSAVVGAEYILGLLPRGTHDYSKFIKPSEIVTELRRLNFNVVDISGMHYVPLINRCFLGDDTSVNYLLHARAVDG